MTEPVIRASHLTRIYQRERQQIMALVNVSLTVPPGEFVAVVGRSGSGKSTLLNVLAGLDHPDSGEVIVNGLPVQQLTQSQAAVFRRDNIGFLFQSVHLLPALTALENVALPLSLSGATMPDYRRRALDLLRAVHMDFAAESLPDMLSGGEQQRVGIARALANNPRLMLADEPTGSLDHETGQYIIDLLKQQVNEYGRAIVMVTHDMEIARQAHRIVTMQDGRLESVV